MQRFEGVRDDCRKHKKGMAFLPKKSTANSAGYDFFSLEDIVIKPKTKYVIWTDIKVCLDKNEFLMIAPRSSIGIRDSLMLANTIGIVDSDYYENEGNDGNITICLYNYGEDDIHISKGDRFAQGIILKTVIDDDEIVTTMTEKRIGGLGSTGK